MKTGTQLAIHISQLFFGGNWTHSNYRDVLEDITWEEAVIKIDSFNTIATLTQHVTYYIVPIKEVLKGGELVAKDELSFTHREMLNEKDWKVWLTQIWLEIDNLQALVEAIPDDQWMRPFSRDKYGTYHRNVLGFIEHGHYHLGQIVLLKKLIRNK